MAKVTVTMEVPKESKEIVDATTAILAHFMAGKSLEQAVDLLPGVMAAVGGYNEIGAEVGGDGLDEIVGYAGWKIVEAIKVKKVEVV